MGLTELLLISLGLAMDAFAVAVCKGLSIKTINLKKAFIVGLWFGVFQCLMPVIGYCLGNVFESFIDSIDNLIAFALLAFIGINMLGEAIKKEKHNVDENLGFKGMIGLAIATSIDALTIGITFAFFDVNVLFAASLIGIITLITSMLGVFLGYKFGNKYEKRAQITGGIILIVLAIKNLLEYIKFI